MKIWLVTIGEPVPVQEGVYDRLYRTGYFAKFLADRGNKVTWWTSTFDHFRKKQLFNEDHVLDIGGNLQIRFLHGCGYRKNVSWQRLMDHRQIAGKFKEYSQNLERPDIIVSAFPTIELSYEAVRFGKQKEIPVILDIRDMWPDIFIQIVPGFLRSFMRIILSPMFRKAQKCFSEATAITGVTESFVDWALELSQRKKSEFDRSFPFGYSRKTLNEEERRKGVRFWEALGVSARKDEFIVCFFGTIGRQFEFETIGRASELLNKRNKPVKFVLCGTGDRLAHYRELFKSNSSILAPGWVGAAELYTLLEIASVGIAPYKETDNFFRNIPNKIPEYLSAGIPVVYSLCRGEVNDVLTSHGCGFSYGNDPLKLANGLEALYKDRSKLEEMSVNGFALYEEKFIAQKVYDGMAEYVQGIVDHAGKKNAAK